jgi:hypothetical protein
MAEELEDHVFTRGGRAKYPWDLWLNGKPWRLRRGTQEQCILGMRDFSVRTRIMRGIAFNYAGRHDLSITTEIEDEDTLYIRCLGKRKR